MNLGRVVRLVAAEAYSDPAHDGIEIRRFYAGDEISDLLNAAREDTLLVTNLKNPQIFRIAEIMDVPAICLLNNATVDPKLIDSALQRGTAVLVSPLDMFEACGRLYRGLHGTEEPDP